MEKFKNYYLDFIVEKNESHGVEVTSRKVYKNQTKSKVIHDIGSFILEHSSGEIKYLNDVDRMYIYARHKETPEITYRLIIRCSDKPVKRTCGQCGNFVPCEGRYACSLNIAEYYSDNGSDILHFMENGDEDASDCQAFDPISESEED